MTTLLHLRRRAEEFAARVDAPAGSPVDPRSERLLAVVGELRRQGEARLADPRPDFAAELRTRLMAEAAAVLDQQATLTLPVRHRSRRERRLVVAATVAVLLGGSTGMAAASQNALPGEALYPVKRAIEQVQAGTATSSGTKGRDLLSQASGRLEEVRGLLDSDSGTAAAQVPGTLDEFRSQARAGANELMASYRDTHDRQTIATVRQFAAKHLTVLTALSVGAPADAEPALRAAANTLRSVDREASDLCPNCTSLPPLKLPSALAASADVDRAPARAQRAGATLDNGHRVMIDKGLVDAAQTEPAKPATPQPQGTASSSAAPSASQSSASAPESALSDSNDPLSGPSSVLESTLPTPQPTAAESTNDTSGASSAGPSGGSPAVPSQGSSASSTGTPDNGAGLGGALDTLLPDSPTPTVKNALP